MSVRPTALSFGSSLTGSLSVELGCPSGEEILESVRVEIKLRCVLVGPDRERLGEIRVVQLVFDFLYPILLNQKEIRVDLRRQTIMFVITNIWKIVEDPWQRVGTGPDHVADHLVIGRVPFGQG